LNLNRLINALIADHAEPLPWCYLAGPMSSVYKRSEIDLLRLCKEASRIEGMLRMMGWGVYNPYGSCLAHENFEFKKELFLEQDLHMISCCDALILLPNWETSEGVTQYELPLAEGLGLAIYTWGVDGMKCIRKARDVQP